jgi:hypothetical protein
LALLYICKIIFNLLTEPAESVEYVA